MKKALRGLSVCLCALILVGCAPLQATSKATADTAQDEPSPTPSAGISASPIPPSPTVTDSTETTTLPETQVSKPALTAVVRGTPIRPLSPGQTVTITNIQMLDPTRGWAIGGVAGSEDHVLITVDGGGTWRDVTPPEPAETKDEPTKIAHGHFLDAERAWVTYSHEDIYRIPHPAVIWRTEDGGETWQASEALDFEDVAEFYVPSALYFVDDLHGWILVHLGAGMSHDYVALLRTTDGGIFWERAVEPGGEYIQLCSKTGLVFADTQNGWLTRDCSGVVEGAFVDQTSDGGQTWSPTQLPAPINEPGLLETPSACGTYFPTLFSPEFGMVVVTCMKLEGDVLTPTEFLYTTMDGGRSWKTNPFPGGALWMLTSNEGWALSRNIYFTKDGGNSWTKVKTVNWDGQFSFVSKHLGWAVARNEGEIALVRTTDDGNLWVQLEPEVTRE